MGNVLRFLKAALPTLKLLAAVTPTPIDDLVLAVIDEILKLVDSGADPATIKAALGAMKAKAIAAQRP